MLFLQSLTSRPRSCPQNRESSCHLNRVPAPGSSKDFEMRVVFKGFSDQFLSELKPSPGTHRPPALPPPTSSPFMGKGVGVGQTQNLPPSSPCSAPDTSSYCQSRYLQPLTQDVRAPEAGATRTPVILGRKPRLGGIQRRPGAAPGPEPPHLAALWDRAAPLCFTGQQFCPGPGAGRWKEKKGPHWSQFSVTSRGAPGSISLSRFSLKASFGGWDGRAWQRSGRREPDSYKDSLAGL